MQRLPYEFVKDQFEREGYKLLSEEYVSVHHKLDYVCPKGHNSSISYHAWKQGKRCSFCANNRKKDINFIKTVFKKERYELLSTVYRNNKQKLNYRCPAGHLNSIRWNNWIRGQRCPICAILGNCGPGNPRWRGGISCEPYCDAWADKEYKESILERDNYQCQNPDCWKTTKKIIIHHIDYDKRNCHPTNLITLCRSCNSRANANRKWHKKFYRGIIKKKYNFKEV